MSRIGKRKISIPEGVELTVNNSEIVAKGPQGTLTLSSHPKIALHIADGEVEVQRKGDDKLARSLHGLYRNLVNNMVLGVSTGFKKLLEFKGTGYRAAVEGDKITLNMGYSHPVILEIPEGLSVKVQKNTISVEGVDKQRVGQFAAIIRSVRKPEPYKGKGIRYADEIIIRKAGKQAKAKGA